MLRRSLILAVLVLLLSSLSARASTYVFGEDGTFQDLTGSGGPGTTWTTGNTYIIAGNVYVDDNVTLTLNAGVTVSFDHNYGGDSTDYPTIEVKGVILCNGTSASPVTFTNLSGTANGEFEGIYLNGADGYEGKLTGSCANFLYGGRTKGIVRIGTDGEFLVSNATVRHSNKHGIYFESTGGLAELDSCSIDSCEDGVSWSEQAGDNGSLEVFRSSFTDNDSAALHVPRRDPVRDRVFWVERNYFRRNQVGVRVFDDLNNETRIYNNYFLEGGAGVVFHRSGNIDGGDEDIYSEIYNNAFARLTYGIVFTDIDYVPQIVEGEPLHVDIRHNVFWDIADDGIYIGDMVWDAGWDDSVWPDWYIKLKLNVFGSCGGEDILLDFEVDNGGYPTVPELNAFELDNNSNNVYLHDAWIVGNSPEISFVDEEWDNAPQAGANDYNFHILWDEERGLINVDGNSQDPDGSPADFGCYGGARGGLGVGGLNDAQNPGGINAFSNEFYEWRANTYWMNCPYYVQLPSDNDPTTGRMVFSTYYMFDDFLCPHVGAGVELYIDTLVSVIAKGVYQFEVEGTVMTGGEERVENSILFRHDTVTGAGWQGIYLDGDNVAGSELYDLEIMNTSSNFSALSVHLCDAGDAVEIENVIIHETGNGLFIYDSNVNVLNLNVATCAYYGIYVATSNADVVTLKNVQSHENFGTTTYSSGLRLYSSSPFIGIADEDFESSISDNDKYGMYCDASSPIMAPTGGTDWGNVDIAGNLNHQIYLKNGSYPVMEYGHNNIWPPYTNGIPTEYAIFFGVSQPNVLDADSNFWGTDDPEAVEDELFSNPALIDYIPFDEEYNDGFDDLRLALAYSARGEYDRAIPMLRSVAENDYAVTRHTALRHLRGCVQRSAGNLDQLRGYLNNLANSCKDPAVAFTAGTEAIMTLHDQDRYEECVAAFIARRSTVATLADSVENEKALIAAGLALQSDRRNSENADLALLKMDEGFAQLESLLDEQGNRATTNVLPSSFALTSIYPNPFNGQTVISFDLNEAGMVDVGVFDLTGRRVATVLQGNLESGSHKAVWNAETASAGVYLVKVNAPNGVRTSRMALVR